MAKKKSKPSVDSQLPNKPADIKAASSFIQKDERIGVNFKYYQSNYECLSAWGKQELKQLSKWIEKTRVRTEADITSTTKTCHALINFNKRRPSGVSKDVQFYGLDVGSKLRVHGFLSEYNFYLVWLDRKHKLLGK